MSHEAIVQFSAKFCCTRIKGLELCPRRSAYDFLQKLNLRRINNLGPEVAIRSEIIRKACGWIGEDIVKQKKKMKSVCGGGDRRFLIEFSSGQISFSPSNGFCHISGALMRFVANSLPSGQNWFFFCFCIGMSDLTLRPDDGGSSDR